jgi:hypothetical protein
MQLLFVTDVSVKIQDSSVGIGTGYGLDDRGIGARLPSRTRNCSLLYGVKIGSEVFVEGDGFEFLPGHPPRTSVVSSVSPDTCLVSILNDVKTGFL